MEERASREFYKLGFTEKQVKEIIETKIPHFFCKKCEKKKKWFDFLYYHERWYRYERCRWTLFEKFPKETVSFT